METVPIVRVMPQDAAKQGAFVEINASDFREGVHTLYVEPGAAVEQATDGDADASSTSTDQQPDVEPGAAVEQTSDNTDGDADASATSTDQQPDPDPAAKKASGKAKK